LKSPRARNTRLSITVGSICRYRLQDQCCRYTRNLSRAEPAICRPPRTCEPICRETRAHSQLHVCIYKPNGLLSFSFRLPRMVKIATTRRDVKSPLVEAADATGRPGIKWAVITCVSSAITHYHSIVRERTSTRLHFALYNARRDSSSEVSRADTRSAREFSEAADGVFSSVVLRWAKEIPSEPREFLQHRREYDYLLRAGWLTGASRIHLRRTAVLATNDFMLDFSSSPSRCCLLQQCRSSRTSFCSVWSSSRNLEHIVAKL